MAEPQPVDIDANLLRVQERIAEACDRVSRSPDEITLVAVTKTRSCEEIVAAYKCGLRHFGENRVEEAALKVPELRDLEAVTWHMIGHIQSRKARRAIELSDYIHSVDSVRLASRLNRLATELGRHVPVLLEINVSGERSKYGFQAGGPAAYDDLEQQVEAFASLEHLEVMGLMTMAPIVSDWEAARPFFSRLRKVRDRLRDRFTFSSWSELSMGMTDDYPVAIEEGATMVRIGRAIFGPRRQ